MKEDYYQDDFESFLRESVEDFKMYPTRKIWRGIYNDVHPAKKWPSLAVTLILIGTILYIGISNNYRINYQHLAATKKIEKKVEILKYGRIYTEPAIISPTNADVAKSSNANISGSNNINRNSGGYTTILIPRFSDEKLIGFVPAIPGNVRAAIFPTINLREIETNAENRSNVNLKMVQAEVVAAKPASSTSGLNHPYTDGLKTEEVQQGLIAKEGFDLPTNEDALIVENNNLQNRQYSGFTGFSPYVIRKINRRNKFLRKLDYGFYITPSVGYRNLYKTNTEPGELAYTNSLLNFNPSRFFKSSELNHYAGLNFEAGANMYYNYTKRLKFKLGFQANHSAYNIDAVELSHPTQTYLSVRKAHSQERELIPVVTYYALEGNFKDYGTKLSNSMLQLSAPLGAEYRLRDGKRTDILIGATIQPTLIAKNTTFLLSYNEKNYAEAPNMIKKFNINTGLELLAEHQTKSGISVIAGPQFRYQLKNSFRPEFNYNETRYQLGFKVGFIKSLVEKK